MVSLSPRDDYEPFLRGRYIHGNSFDSYYESRPRHASPWAAVTVVPSHIYKTSVTRFGRRKGPALLGFCCLALLLTTFVLHRRIVSAARPTPSRPSAAVFGREELQKIWEWEVRSGHYPSTRPVPVEVGFTAPVANPALPGRPGAQRIYPNVQTTPPDFGHPPRPIAGSVADLDRILEQCDYDTGKYVRDCLEFLRIGGGLDNSVRLRREDQDLEHLRYIYVLNGGSHHITERADNTTDTTNYRLKLTALDNWEHDLPPPIHTLGNQASSCVENDPRIFHMFWAGPFTDKPYMAMLAFLFTQNLGLHMDSPPSDLPFCRPQMWIWVSHGTEDDSPNPDAEEEMYDTLRNNAWASPFLNPRFKDIIQFRLWNTTQQLDSVDELKDDWRRVWTDLRSDGHPLPKGDNTKKVGSSVALDGNSKETHMTYSKLPVILSDIVRFVLCHRYGGVYLDVDMLLLRDWEELWGWSGSFSYRWAHMVDYNTAVLRLRRGSALGTFLMRSALKNGLDFHPTTVSKYIKDANMEELLFRVPDALFDPNWLLADYTKFLWMKLYFQRDRPPMPFFPDFDNFFNTPPEMSGMPSAIGFDGFFRGAYIYHYHNEWWKPFDRARYWPDLGPRFADAERMGREAIANDSISYSAGMFEKDKRDLDWATVLKRTFEAYMRGERPNMYGEWIRW